MKIKTKQKLNLPELIQYVWENEAYPNRYINNFNREVVFNDTGKFMTDESFISPNSYFTMEVCEELTEDTGIPGATFVYYYTPNEEVKVFSYSENARPTINHIIELHHENKALAIYVGQTLIWSRESGIPESGVVEVDDE